MMRIIDQIDAFIQIIQRNNLKPQQRQDHKVQWNVVVEAELESNKDDKADKKGSLRRQYNHFPNGIKLKVPSFRGNS